MNSKIIMLACMSMLVLACGERKNAKSTETEPTAMATDSTVANYPDELKAVFKAHGGIETWFAMNTLKFDLGEGAEKETHTIDLKTRKVAIASDKFKLGFDGDEVWVAPDSTAFPLQRARFYHNLMFYFYAMPFVLGDEGINYTEAVPLDFEGVGYPGIRISYNDGVGDSSKDEYVLYFNPDDHRMTWLAYTVTFGKDTPSKEFSFIKYDTWQEVDGLLLPRTLQWYSVENGLPLTMKNERVYSNVSLSKEKMGDATYAKPENGMFAE